MAGQRKRNPNGAGTITKRKDGRFQCAVYVLQPDGTRARKFAYGKTWAECDTKRRELLSKVDQGVPVPTKSAKLSEWLPYWLDNVIKPRGSSARTTSTRRTSGSTSCRCSARSGSNPSASRTFVASSFGWRRRPPRRRPRSLTECCGLLCPRPAARS